MSYSVLNLKQDLTGVLHGTTLNQITNLDGLIDRAARKVLADVDPQETKRILQLPVAYQQVFDYACPVDLKGNKIIDIFPQTPRYPSDQYLQSYNQAFDLAKNWVWQDMFTILWNQGVRTLRLNGVTLPNVPNVLNYADNITDNGTWATAGDASNLTVDNINYFVGGGALEFDLASSGSSGSLANSTMGAVDLSDVENQSSFFFQTFLPVGADFTSISLRVGSGSSNYWTGTVTTTQQNTVFQNGWNLLQYEWADMSIVGSPDSSSITFIDVIWNYNGTAQTAVRLNGVTSTLGSILQVEYYSKYLFRNASTGAFQENVDDDSNLVNLDTDSYNLLFDMVAYFAIQQQQGMNALKFDANFFLTQYTDDLMKYRAKYKSELQKPQGSYYTMPQSGYTRFITRRWS